MKTRKTYYIGRVTLNESGETHIELLGEGAVPSTFPNQREAIAVRDFLLGTFDLDFTVFSGQITSIKK